MQALYWEGVIKLEVPIGQTPPTSALLIVNDALCLTQTLQIEKCNDGLTLVIGRKDDEIRFVIAVNRY